MKQNIRFIGDVHGYFNRYRTILTSSTEPTIQIGDMGVGFFSPYGVPSDNPPYDSMVKHNARFIRGNHDNPDVCKRHSQFIADGTKETIGESKVMFIGGAWSIDREWRTEDYNWWADEECSHAELYRLVDEYNEYKPDVMVTHDAPERVVRQMFGVGTHKPLYSSRTGQALDSMFAGHKPRYWIYGHWHRTAEMDVQGCQCVCLDELNTRVFEL